MSGLTDQGEDVDEGRLPGTSSAKEHRESPKIDMCMVERTEPFDPDRG